MPAKELAEFLGPVSKKAITWRKYLGPDFQVYYGHANAPLSGKVGFYVGFFPKTRKPEAGSTTIESKLGIFPVTWRRFTTEEGFIQQDAMIQLDDAWKVDIWFYARRQRDIDKLIPIIAQLPTFTKKPVPL